MDTNGHKPLYEDYVSFETAKLLAKKGFDEIKCNTCYKWNGNFCNNRKSMSGVDNKICYQAPTLQMAMKWLRKMHSIHIGVLVTYQHRPRKYEAHIMNLEEIDDFILQQTVDFDSPEEACEAAIKYCLENFI